MTPAIIAVTIAAGSVATVARYAVSQAFAGMSRANSFPWAVLVVNVLGSALGGAALGLAQSSGLSEELRFVILTGVCGGLTTFSTFSVETIQLMTHGLWRTAVVSVATNLLVGLGACIAGYLVCIA